MRTRCVFAAVAVAAAIAIPAPPAGASPFAGSLTFSCTASLEGWPWNSGFGSCDERTSNLDGPAVGVVEATGFTDSGRQFVVEGFAPLLMWFRYTDNCQLAGAPLTGTASGDLIIERLPAVLDGDIVTSADLYADFQWTRVGTATAITITSFRFTVHGADSATGRTGAGAGTFIPSPSPGNTCPHGSGRTEALVTGEVGLTG